MRPDINVELLDVRRKSLLLVCDGERMASCIYLEELS
jgi:hypothetical protein